MTTGRSRKSFRFAGSAWLIIVQFMAVATMLWGCSKPN